MSQIVLYYFRSEYMALTRSLESLLRVDRDILGLVGNDGLELVEDDLGAVELGARLLDGVGDGGSDEEVGDVLAKLVEGQGHVLSGGTAQLGLGLVTEDDDASLGVLGKGTLGSLRHAGVDTTAQTAVRGDGDEDSLALSRSLGLGVCVHGYIIRHMSISSLALNGCDRTKPPPSTNEEKQKRVESNGEER